jgi:hypothetical protein
MREQNHDGMLSQSLSWQARPPKVWRYLLLDSSVMLSWTDFFSDFLGLVVMQALWTASL